MSAGIADDLYGTGNGILEGGRKIRVYEKSPRLYCKTKVVKKQERVHLIISDEVPSLCIWQYGQHLLVANKSLLPHQPNEDRRWSFPNLEDSVRSLAAR